MNDERLLQIPEAIKKLFGIDLAHYKPFKDLVYPLVRSGFIQHKRKPIPYSVSDRNHIWIAEGELIKLHNAILIQGVFTDTKTVKSFFEEKAKRVEKAKTIRYLLQDRQSATGIGLISYELQEFFKILESDEDLTSKNLPNPFIELPQLSLSGVTSLMQALLAQSAVISDDDSMLLLYLDGQLEAAWGKAQHLESAHPILLKHKELINQEYLRATEFDQLLDDLIME
ncbi:hypothetical protein [Neptunomonas japonica]|uniref:Uncharacterized protein n=1 Tax=Neptunomonas japonica JAMM 1380 TaxID=1441457 RepID=A0A7R6SWK4_9GAMM|nr:hypothetical protein [Neptunomonas japonica]BBB29880.1 conserved hypothetical protein [Neptunomonas japonica JAMM 1380]